MSLAGPAQARGAGLLVSGSASGPFADQLPAPLLDGLGRVVPLDNAGDTFYVKNGSPRAARTTVAVVNRGPVNELTAGLMVTVDVDGTASTRTLPPDGRRCDLVVTGPTLGPGEVQPVEVSFTFGELTGQHGTHERFALDVDATLSHLAGPHRLAVCGEQPDRDRGGGPRRWGPTGEPAAVAGTAVTVVVLAGLVMLAVRRRRAAARADDA